MSETVRIRLDDALVGRLPRVCCMTGAPADGYAPVVVPEPLGAAWLLLLAGPIGLLVLFALYPRLRTRYLIKVPMSAGAFERNIALQRRRLWGATAGLVLVLAAIALRWLGVVAVALGAGGALCIGAAILAHLRVPWTVPSATADGRGRWVTLRGVHGRFAEAVR